MGIKEIGFGPLALTEDGKKSPLVTLGDTPVLHWHGDQFDIPAEALRLASTAIGQNQAFTLGRSVLALQFHLEVDTRQIERWLVGHASELAQAGIDPRTLRTQAQHHREGLTLAARKVVGTWLEALQA
jgi:GMP synthase (glutamine-hydrolysing)